MSYGLVSAAISAINADRLDKDQAHVKELQLQLDRLKTEDSKDHDQIKQLHDSINQLKFKDAEDHKHLTEVEGSNRKLQAENVMHVKRIKELEAQLVKFQAEDAKDHAQIKALHSVIDKLKAEDGKDHAHIKELEELVGNFKERSLSSQEEEHRDHILITKLDKQATMLKTHVEALQALVRKLQAEDATDHAHIQELETIINRLKLEGEDGYAHVKESHAHSHHHDDQYEDNRRGGERHDHEHGKSVTTSSTALYSLLEGIFRHQQAHPFDNGLLTQLLSEVDDYERGRDLVTLLLDATQRHTHHYHGYQNADEARSHHARTMDLKERLRSASSVNDQFSSETQHPGHHGSDKNHHHGMIIRKIIPSDRETYKGTIWEDLSDSEPDYDSDKGHPLITRNLADLKNEEEEEEEDHNEGNSRKPTPFEKNGMNHSHSEKLSHGLPEEIHIARAHYHQARKTHDEAQQALQDKQRQIIEPPISDPNDVDASLEKLLAYRNHVNNYAADLQKLQKLANDTRSQRDRAEKDLEKAVYSHYQGR